MDKTLELLKQIIVNKNDYLVVGISSGPDSMCLLDLLYKYKYKVVCAHVNHNIRKESIEEYNFLKKYCEEKNIIFEGLELPKSNHSEAYYRKKRYDFYKSLGDKYNTKYILTAHHGDDLIETILMRINRGSNLKGYIGFSKVFNEKGYIMIKPLIYYTKDEILEYNKKYGVPYFNDKTNEEDTYTRNRYRHHILPFLKSENKDIHKKFLSFSEELNDAKNYIDTKVKEAMDENYKNNVIDTPKFNKLDNYIKVKELELILSNIYGDDIDKINKKHIEKIIELSLKDKNFNMNMPCNMIVKKEYNKLVIESLKKNDKYKIEIKNEVILDNGYVIKKLNSTNDNSNYTIKLNSKDIKLPLYVRSRIDGDKMEVKNLKGTKKIKSIFIDEKVSPSIRDTYPIVVDANDTILWIPGLKKSKFDSDLKEKYDIILKYERKGKLDEE